MFAAIGRFLRAIGFMMIGRMDKATDALSADPLVVNARYAEVIRVKIARMQEYMDAVAGLITVQEKKKAQMKVLIEGDGNRERGVKGMTAIMKGALAKAQKVAAALQAKGLTPDQIKLDPDYIKCQRAYQDFESTLKEKEQRVTELEKDIETLQTKIEEHKIGLKALSRDIDKIKVEQHEAVADIITAQQEK